MFFCLGKNMDGWMVWPCGSDISFNRNIVIRRLSSSLSLRRWSLRINQGLFWPYICPVTNFQILLKALGRYFVPE